MSKNKLSTEERIKAVESYIQGIMVLSEVLRTYAIPKSTFEKWVHKYKCFGVSGLTRQKRNTTYTRETKKHAVEEYLSGKGSLLGICKNIKFIQIASYEVGLRCIMVIKNYDPAEVEGVISI